MSRGPSILVVDDEPAVRHALERALLLERYEVTLARDGRELLRRVEDDAGPAAGVLRYADLVLDPLAHDVHRGERRIDLTRTEFLLLAMFLSHPRQVLTRSQIFERVWGYDFGTTSNALGV